MNPVGSYTSVPKKSVFVGDETTEGIESAEKAWRRETFKKWGLSEPSSMADVFFGQPPELMAGQRVHALSDEEVSHHVKKFAESRFLKKSQAKSIAYAAATCVKEKQLRTSLNSLEQKTAELEGLKVENVGYRQLVLSLRERERTSSSVIEARERDLVRVNSLLEKHLSESKSRNVISEELLTKSSEPVKPQKGRDVVVPLSGSSGSKKDAGLKLDSRNSLEGVRVAYANSGRVGKTVCALTEASSPKKTIQVENGSSISGKNRNQGALVGVGVGVLIGAFGNAYFYGTHTFAVACALGIAAGALMYFIAWLSLCLINWLKRRSKDAAVSSVKM